MNNDLKPRPFCGGEVAFGKIRIGENWAMNNKLRQCPFCGGKAKFGKLDFASNAQEDCIACTKCSAVLTLDYVDPEKDDLADVWNRRASDE